MRRSNGEDVLVPHGAARYTTQDLLDAEQRLLDHAQQPTRYGLPGAQVDAFLAGFEERNDVTLDPGQRRLVHAFATGGRRLVVAHRARGRREDHRHAAPSPRPGAPPATG